MEIVIEKNVPMPPPKKPRSYGLTGLMRNMAIGDSFVIPLEKRHNIYNLARTISGTRFVTLKVSDTEARVWRTE